MVSTVDGLFTTGVLLGLLLCWASLYTHRRRDQLGTTAFAAFVAFLGAGTALGGLAGVLGLAFPSNDGAAVWRLVPIFFWIFSAVPWFVFALQYTGRYTRIRPRTVAVLSVLPFGIVVQIALNVVGIEALVLLTALGSVVVIYSAGLMIVGAYLVVETTYAYGHLSVRQGLSLAAIPIGTFVVWNVISLQEIGATSAAALYVVGAGVALAGTAITLVRYDTFASTPAVGTIGERAIARETDDLVFVVDDRDRIIKLNRTAVETLGVTRADSLGIQVSELLGHGTEPLRSRETVTLETGDGTRRYDPEVSAVTDQHDRWLGFIVSLRDVTERELREQRLAVLNRVLRHNLRNKIEVVKSHAEAIESDDDHADRILATADEIADLGYSTRRIDQFVSESARETTVDVATLARETLARVEREAATDSVAVSITTPESATVETNRAALAAALESAIENAVSYAESTVTVTVEDHDEGYELRVADDGPGIPQGELDAVGAGTETALDHGSGLGLWQLTWAVRTIDGDLSFDTTDGTTVTIVVPEEPGDESAGPDPTDAPGHGGESERRELRADGASGSSGGGPDG